LVTLRIRLEYIQKITLFSCSSLVPVSNDFFKNVWKKWKTPRYPKMKWTFLWIIGLYKKVESCPFALKRDPCVDDIPYINIPSCFPRLLFAKKETVHVEN